MSKNIDWIMKRKELGQYKKKLVQPMEPEEYSEALKDYFKNKRKFNIYSLATHVGMSKYRFEQHYQKSENPLIREMTQVALDMIAGHALENEFEYGKALRYVMTYAETGKQFLELSEEAQDISANKVIQLPQKDFDDDK